MLVCHCMAVHERQVRDEVAGGAHDVVEVAERCGAGTVCGGCVPTIASLLSATDSNGPLVGSRAGSAAT